MGGSRRREGGIGQSNALYRLGREGWREGGKYREGGREGP